MSTDTRTHDTDVRGAWRVVAEREVVTRLHQKSFAYSVLAMVVGIVATVVLASVIGGKPSDHAVGAVGPRATEILESSSEAMDRVDEGSTITPRELDSVAAAERAVREGDVDAALVATDDGFEVLGDSQIDSSLSTVLTTVASSAALSANAADQGVDLAELQQGSQVSERLLDPKEDDAEARSLTSFVFVLLFYVTAVTFGMTIAQSVVVEKESRIVEILAAAVPIRAMLWGKIAGNTILALAQIVVLVGSGVAALAVTGQTELLSAIGPAAAWYVVFFVLGFVALAGLWAVAGSLASRQEDLGSTTLPGQIVLFAPYILAVTAGASVKTVVSMLPIVSAMMMPSRMAEGSVPAWQIGVALAVNVVGAILLVRFAARLYERTLMRTERRIGFGEALRLRE